VIGGYAYGFYAEPRYTKDLDIWIACDKLTAKRVYKVLREFGAPVDNLSPHDFNTAGLIYIFGLAPIRIDILNSIKKANFDKMFRNKNTFLIDEVNIPVVAKEDLIKLKTLANRPQDRLDVKKLKATERANAGIKKNKLARGG